MKGILQLYSEPRHEQGPLSFVFASSLTTDSIYHIETTKSKLSRSVFQIFFNREHCHFIFLEKYEQLSDGNIQNSQLHKDKLLLRRVSPWIRLELDNLLNPQEQIIIEIRLSIFLLTFPTIRQLLSILFYLLSFL